MAWLSNMRQIMQTLLTAFLRTGGDFHSLHPPSLVDGLRVCNIHPKKHKSKRICGEKAGTPTRFFVSSEAGGMNGLPPKNSKISGS